MTQLPSSWAWASLSDVACWGSGGTPTAGDPRFYDGEIPWAVIGDLNDAIVTETASAITDEGLAFSSAKVVPEGTILIAMYGSIGKLGIAGRPMATNQAIAFARVDRRIIEDRYLFWFLLSERNNFMQAGKGATQKNISQTVLKPWPIPVPPLPEQRRIAAALDDHLSRVDAGSIYLNGAGQQEARLRVAIYTAAVEGRLVTLPQKGEPIAKQFDAERHSRWRKAHGDRKYKPPAEPDLEIRPLVPDSWHVVSLEAATDPVRLIQYGILMPRVKAEGSVPYVEVKDLAGETLCGKKLHRTSRELDEQFSRSRLAKNDVVMAVRGSYERSAVVPEALEGANVSRDVVRIAPLTELDPDYLHIYLQSAFSRRYFAHHARRVAVKGVNTASVRSLPVVIPTLEVQREIVREVRYYISAVNKVSAEVSNARKRASNLRKSLLVDAFAGKLVPQDPTDEPVGALLERIHAEKQGTQLRARRGRTTAKQTSQGEMLL